MDNTPKHESLYEWLQRRGLPGLPAEPRRETSLQGEVILHHPDGCPYRDDTARGETRSGPEGTPRLCGCLFKDLLHGTTERVFLNEMLSLFYAEDTFQRSVNRDLYNLGDAFPQLRALIVRHHRWYIENSYHSRGIIRDGHATVRSSALQAVGANLVDEWDAAIAANPPDDTLLTDEIIRYAARHMMSRFTLRKTVGLHLPLMNAMQELVWHWLTRPVTGTLVEEYYSEAGDHIRDVTVHSIAGSGFSLELLETINAEAEAMLARSTLMACHLGGPDTNVFETGEGLRPVIVWNGLRAQRASTGLGEYPQIVCEWFAQQDEERKRGRGIAGGPPPGGAVIPICESLGLDTQQWETAITLWEDSFAAGKDDPGPYRDQKTAILAAANL